MWYRDGSYFPLIVGIWMGTTFVAAEAHPYLLMGRDPPPEVLIWEFALKIAL